MVTVCISLFEAIGELQRKRLRQSRAAVFSWNSRTCGQFLQAKSWVRSSLLRHRPHRAWSVTGTFYTGEVEIPCEGWCNWADFMEISKFPEILGELSMRKQCVPGSFFSAHALEPGNEARSCIDVVTCVKPLASYPGSNPAYHCLQYGKACEPAIFFLREMT